MFEKIGQSAEKVVGKVSQSRRGFLGSAAKLVASVGAAMAGLAAFPGKTQAAWPPARHCHYKCEDGSKVNIKVSPFEWCPLEILHPKTGVDCYLG